LLGFLRHRVISWFWIRTVKLVNRLIRNLELAGRLSIHSNQRIRKQIESWKKPWKWQTN
jgi:hypothetical protein